MTGSSGEEQRVRFTVRSPPFHRLIRKKKRNQGFGVHGRYEIVAVRTVHTFGSFLREISMYKVLHFGANRLDRALNLARLILYFNVLY